MSSFTHPHVISNLCDFLLWNTNDILKNVSSVFIHTMKVIAVQNKQNWIPLTFIDWTKKH